MNHNKVCDNFGRYVLYLRVVFSLNLGILLAASIFMFFESSSRIIIPRSHAGCSFVTPVNQYNVHGCINKTCTQPSGKYAKNIFYSFTLRHTVFFLSANVCGIIAFCYSAHQVMNMEVAVMSSSATPKWPRSPAAFLAAW